MNRILITNKHNSEEIYLELDSSLRFHLCTKYGHILGCFLFRINQSSIIFDNGVGNNNIIPSIDVSYNNLKLIIVSVDEL